MTAERTQRARSLRSGGLSFQEVADCLGVGYHAVRGALDPAYKERRRTANGLAERKRLRTATGNSRGRPPKSGATGSPVPPPDVLAERDRIAAIPQTIGMRLLGDPPACRSALGYEI